MKRSRCNRWWRIALLCLGLITALITALGACSSLPDDGPVRKVNTVRGNEVLEPPFFQPAGPGPGDSREAIVRGFLTAMEANPVSIRAARSFLTGRAAEGWRPNNETLVYQASALNVSENDVGVRLSGVSRLSEQGTWSPGSATRDLSMGLVREKGEWRIDSPPDALVVGAAFFRGTFAAYKVYFYDNTGSVLVPRIVHLPRGEQTATNLVRALLSGPDSNIEAVTSSAFPARTQLDLAVTVTRNGIAEVPVSSNVLNLSTAEVTRAMVQLAWTLRAVPGIDRVELTVGGVPVPLADGRTGVSIDDRGDLAAYGTRTTRSAVAVVSGKVVLLDGSEVVATNGPLGRRGVTVRSVAQDRDGTTLVAISEDGTRAYQAPTGGTTGLRRIATGTDLSRPVIDRHGRVWLLDRTRSGARILLRQHDRTGELTVPGMTGAAISQIAISPDGVRLAAVLTDKDGPAIPMSNVVRDASGDVVRMSRTPALSVDEAAARTDVGKGVDVGWLDEATLVVLTAPTRTTSRLVMMLADGSASDINDQLDDLSAEGVALLAGPAPDAALGVLDARGHLHRADAAGKWLAPLPERFTGVAYAN